MRTVMVPVQRAPPGYPGLNGQAMVDASFEPEAEGLVGPPAEASRKQAVGIGVPQTHPGWVTSTSMPSMPKVYPQQGQSAEAVIQQLNARANSLEQERERILTDNRALKAQVENARGSSVAFDFLKLARGVRAKAALQGRRRKSDRGSKPKGAIWDSQRQQIMGEPAVCWLEHLPCCGENGELRRRLEQAETEQCRLDQEVQEAHQARHDEVTALRQELELLRQNHQMGQQNASSSQAVAEAKAAAEVEIKELQRALGLVGEQRAAELAELRAELARKNSESESLRKDFREARKSAEEYRAKLDVRKEVHIQELGEQQRLVDHLLERTRILSTELEARETELAKVTEESAGTAASASTNEVGDSVEQKGKKAASKAATRSGASGASNAGAPSAEVLSALAELRSPATELMGAVGMTLPTPSEAALVPWIRALSSNMTRLASQLQRRGGAPSLAAARMISSNVT